MPATVNNVIGFVLESGFMTVIDRVRYSMVSAQAAARLVRLDALLEGISHGPVDERIRFRFWMWALKRRLPHSFSEMHFGEPLEYYLRHAENTHEANCLSSGQLGEIMRDIGRTFPDHEFFSENCAGQEMLARILKAIVSSRPDVGYCQGMNFIVGALLLARLSSEKIPYDVMMRNSTNQLKELRHGETDAESEISMQDRLVLQRGRVESDVFWAIQCLLVNGGEHSVGDCGLLQMETIWRPGFPKMKLRVYQFDRLFKWNLPDLHAHCEDITLSSEVVVSQWFMTLFSYTVPLEFTYHIWDYIFVSAWPGVFKITLAILYVLYDKLIEMDLEEVGLMMRDWKRGKFNLPVTIPEVIQRADKFSVTEETLVALQEGYALEMIAAALGDKVDTNGSMSKSFHGGSMGIPRPGGASWVQRYGAIPPQMSSDMEAVHKELVEMERQIEKDKEIIQRKILIACEKCESTYESLHSTVTEEVRWIEKTAEIKYQLVKWHKKVTSLTLASVEDGDALKHTLLKSSPIVASDGNEMIEVSSDSSCSESGSYMGSSECHSERSGYVDEDIEGEGVDFSDALSDSEESSVVDNLEGHVEEHSPRKDSSSSETDGGNSCLSDEAAMSDGSEAAQEMFYKVIMRSSDSQILTSPSQISVSSGSVGVTGTPTTDADRIGASPQMNFSPDPLMSFIDDSKGLGRSSHMPDRCSSIGESPSTSTAGWMTTSVAEKMKLNPNRRRVSGIVQGSSPAVNQWRGLSGGHARTSPTVRSPSTIPAGDRAELQDPSNIAQSVLQSYGSGDSTAPSVGDATLSTVDNVPGSDISCTARMTQEDITNISQDLEAITVNDGEVAEPESVVHTDKAPEEVVEPLDVPAHVMEREEATRETDSGYDEDVETSGIANTPQPEEETLSAASETGSQVDSGSIHGDRESDSSKHSAFHFRSSLRDGLVKLYRRAGTSTSHSSSGHSRSGSNCAPDQDENTRNRKTSSNHSDSPCASSDEIVPRMRLHRLNFSRRRMGASHNESISEKKKRERLSIECRKLQKKVIKLTKSLDAAKKHLKDASHAKQMALLADEEAKEWKESLCEQFQLLVQDSNRCRSQKLLYIAETYGM